MFRLLPLLLFSLMAQDPTPATSDDEELLSEVRKTTTVVFEAWEDLKSRQELVVENDSRIAEFETELETEVTRPAKLSELLDEGTAYLESQLTRYDLYASEVAARQAALASAQELGSAQLTALQDLGKSRDTVVTTIEKLRPWVVELVARIESGRIEAEAVDLGVEGYDLERLNRELDGFIAASAAENEALAARLTKLHELNEVLTKETSEIISVEDLQSDRVAIEILLAVSQLEDSRRQQLEKADPAEITGVINRTMKEWPQSLAAVDLERKTAFGLLDELTALEEKRHSITLAKRESFETGVGHEELQAARQGLAYAQAMLENRRERLALLKQARAISRDLIEILIKGGPLIQVAKDHAVDLRAATALAAGLVEEGRMEAPEIPEESSAAAVWELLKPLVADEARRIDSVTKIKADLENEVPMTLATDDVAAQEKEVSAAQRVLDEELIYVDVVEEMRKLSDAELLNLLGESGAAHAELATARAVSDKEHEELDQIMEEVWDTVTRLESLDGPQAQLVIDENSDRGEQIRVELQELPKGEALLPRDASEDWHRMRTLVAGIKRQNSDSDPNLEPDAAEIETLKRRQRFAREVLTYFNELDDLSHSLGLLQEELATAADECNEALSQVISCERNRAAAARELHMRVLFGRVPPSQEPEENESWARRELVAAAEAARESFRARAEALRSTIQRVQDSTEVILNWKPWAERADEASRRAVALIGQPIAHVAAAVKKVEDLREYERESLVYQAEVLNEAEEPGYQIFLEALVEPKIRQRYEEPLQSHYLELVDTQRKAGEYEQASRSYEDLITVRLDWRKDLEEAVSPGRKIEALRLREYQVARHIAGMVAEPSRRVAIQAAYLEATGQDLPVTPRDLEVVTFGWANRLLSAEARLWAARRSLALVEHGLSRGGIESEVHRTRTHISQILTEVDNLKTSSSHLRDEIANLRQSYLGALKGNSLSTLGRILLIPLLAFLFMRLTHFFIQRVKKKARIDPDGNPTVRQRRLQTVSAVLHTSIGVLVWSVAAIYVLSRLGLDVTPLIASASVAGLALAFGAQSLIKDFFAGFFILFENQYAVGDIVDLGPAAGTVESISLRATMLRDLQGVVHYVPNGLVERVSNKTKGWSRVVLEITVPYGEDIDRVRDLLTDVLAALARDPEWAGKLLDDPVVLGVQALGESSMSLRIMAKTQPGEQWAVARELRERAKKALDEHGIVAPVPHRVIHQVQVESHGGHEPPKSD